MDNHALPNLDLAKLLFRETSKKLWLSFNHLLESIGEKDSNLSKLVDKHKEHSKAAPFFFAAHEVLANHYLRNKPSSKKLIDQLLNFNSYTHHKNLSILPFTSNSNLQDDIYKSVIVSDIKATYERAENMRWLPEDFNSKAEYSQSTAQIKNALAIIKDSDHTLYEEIKFIVNEIRIFKSGNLRAGSTFNTLGLIYVGKHSNSDSVSRYIEHIVHEAAHNLLYAHWTMDLLFKNHNNNLYYTPFRKDHRPLSAIYHAMFVLARTIYIFNQIQKHNPNSLDFSKIKTNYNEQGNNTSFKIKFSQTVDIIQKHAILTNHGSSIVNSCIDLVDTCDIRI